MCGNFTKGLVTKAGITLYYIGVEHLATLAFSRVYIINQYIA